MSSSIRYFVVFQVSGCRVVDYNAYYELQCLIKIVTGFHKTFFGNYSTQSAAECQRFEDRFKQMSDGSLVPTIRI